MFALARMPTARSNASDRPRSAMLSSERWRAATKPLNDRSAFELAVIVLAQRLQPFLVAGRALPQACAKNLLQARKAFEAEVLGKRTSVEGLDVGRSRNTRRRPKAIVRIVERVGRHLFSRFGSCALRSRITASAFSKSAGHRQSFQAWASFRASGSLSSFASV